jgi:hypothetical protein
MDAPDVVVLMVTLCALEYVPAAGLKLGVATVPVTVKETLTYWGLLLATPEETETVAV